MAGIQKQSLVDMIYSQLRNDIIHLRYDLGSKLSVSVLQSQLGVSCTPIREAINRLQLEGLVSYENNIGAHIISLRRHDVEEIQQLAMTLHTAAIRLAMKNGDTFVILSALDGCLTDLRAARTPDDEVDAIYGFLGTFYHNSGNRRLDASMQSIQGQQLLLRHMYANHGSSPEDLICFEAMVTCAAAGDINGICAQLQRYTDHMTGVLMELVPA